MSQAWASSDVSMGETGILPGLIPQLYPVWASVSQFITQSPSKKLAGLSWVEFWYENGSCKTSWELEGTGSQVTSTMAMARIYLYKDPCCPGWV